VLSSHKLAMWQRDEHSTFSSERGEGREVCARQWCVSERCLTKRATVL
jgi:hypothetical protein